MAVHTIAANTRRESEPVHVRDLAATPPNACQQLQERITWMSSFPMAKYHTRAQYWCTFQLGCYVHAIFLLSDTTTSQTSNVIIRELYLESRQVDLGDREAGGGQQS